MKNFVCFMIAIVLTFMLHATTFAGERKTVDIRELAPRIVYDETEKCIENPCGDEFICFKDNPKGRDHFFRTVSKSCEKKYGRTQPTRNMPIPTIGLEEGKIADVFLEGGCRKNPCPRGPAYICWEPGGWMTYWTLINFYCAFEDITKEWGTAPYEK